MLENDIVWVKLVHSDKSENVFRGTRSLAIIKDLVGELPDRDVYDLDSDDFILKSEFIFNVKTLSFIDTSGTIVTVSDSKPEFSRRVDKYANSFI